MTDDPRPAPAPGPAVPPDRYGRSRRPPSRRVLIPLAVVLTAGGVAAAAYATWATGRHPHGQVVTFRTADDGVQITANVRRDPAKPTECALRARNEAGFEVGRRTVVIPPGDGRKVTISEFLQTRERPVTGEIMECRSVPRAPAARDH